MPGASPNLRSPADPRQVGPELPAHVARVQLGMQSQPSGEDLNQSLGSHVADRPFVHAGYPLTAHDEDVISGSVFVPPPGSRMVECPDGSGGNLFGIEYPVRP